MPYAKTVACILDFIRDNSKDKESDIRILGSAFSDHELGLLYAFSNSEENANVIVNHLMDSFIQITKLPELYNYRKW